MTAKFLSKDPDLVLFCSFEYGNLLLESSVYAIVLYLKSILIQKSLIWVKFYKFLCQTSSRSKLNLPILLKNLLFILICPFLAIR